MNREIITDAFISHVADILGETNQGLSGSDICKYCVFYATEYNCDIPHIKLPFEGNGGIKLAKNTALLESLKCFLDIQLYVIIRNLCELEKFKDNDSVRTLKGKLARDYSALAIEGEIEEEFIEETSHWLENYTDVLLLYNEAYRKYKSQDEQLYRNTLDDVRLALELLLKVILGNNKSLENQKGDLGKLIVDNGGTTEFSNIFWQLLNLYSIYQNKNVKHNDDIAEVEITFIFELTTVFMKQLVRINS